MELINIDIYCADLPDEYIDVAVFSPPYKGKDGYDHALMAHLGSSLERWLKPGGLVFMNFGQLSEDFLRPFTAFQWLLGPHPRKLSPLQTIIWVKSLVIDERQRGHFQTINSDSILNYCHEYIFVAYKPPKPKLDKLSIGVEYADKSNLQRGTRGKNGDIHCAGDVWFVPYETTGQTTKKKHKYEYPLEIPTRCLKLSGKGSGAKVLDPFCGSGVTGVAAKQLGMDFVGIDKDPECLKTAKERFVYGKPLETHGESTE